MKALIVDNNTKHIDALKNLLKDFETDVRDYSNIGKTEEYDLIVLSGGYSRAPVIQQPQENLEETQLIIDSTVPVLGICYGAQLIANTFGGKIIHLPEKRIGIIEVSVIEEDEIFKGIKDFSVYESHEYCILQLSDELRGLARSADGYEVIKHKDRPIYGFQFHPELDTQKAYGDDIFRNLLKIYFKK